jgi:hypothetical protein
MPMRPEEAATCKEELASHDSACNDYRNGDFAGAVEAFRHLCEQFPDKHLYTVYEQRSRTLVQSPPEQWDGV